VPASCCPRSPITTVGAGDTPAVARSRTHQRPAGRLGEATRSGGGVALEAASRGLIARWQAGR
jgi:hypothetical protein